MSRFYICAVSSRFPENYELGVRRGTWGVEAKYRAKLARVRRGDRVVFVVGGQFRSIHPVTREPYEDHTRIWPPKDGDIFPYRIGIGPAEVEGRVRGDALATAISFMKKTIRWSGTIMGANGVFNDRLTSADVELIASALARSAAVQDAEKPVVTTRAKVIQVEGARWLPELLDQLARMSALEPDRRFSDPLQDAAEWRTGLVSRVYADRRAVPTLGILPVDRDPHQTVLSTLYGLSALKQASGAPRHVRGMIFVPRAEHELGTLLRGLTNLASVPFELQVRLRN